MRNISTIPKNIFVYGCSHGGSSFKLMKHLNTTIVSLFFQKRKKKKKKIKKKKKERKKEKKKKKKRKERNEKEKEREDTHNQSINHWCLTHLSCISKGLYGWVKVILIQVGCYCYELGLDWIFYIWFLYLIFQREQFCLYLAIRLYYHWA